MKRIMIVEDDKKITFALTLRLKSHGYSVTVAHDPVVGLSKIVEVKPDLILLDLSMPAGGGLLMAERVIYHQQLDMIPIIIITANPNPEFRKQASDLGIKYFFEKPLNTSELLQAIKGCVGE